MLFITVFLIPGDSIGVVGRLYLKIDERPLAGHLLPQGGFGKQPHIAALLDNCFDTHADFQRHFALVFESDRVRNNLIAHLLILNNHRNFIGVDQNIHCWRNGHPDFRKPAAHRFNFRGSTVARLSGRRRTHQGGQHQKSHEQKQWLLFCHRRALLKNAYSRTAPLYCQGVRTVCGRTPRWVLCFRCRQSGRCQWDSLIREQQRERERRCTQSSQ